MSPYGVTRAQWVKVIAGHGISSKQLFRSMMIQFTDAYMGHGISRWFFLAGWDRVPLDIVAAICHDDVIKWKHFPRYWPFVRGIHRSPMNSLHKGQWRGAFMFSLICAWINLWVNNREAGDWRRYDAIALMMTSSLCSSTYRSWVQKRRNSSALAMKLRISWTNPSLCVDIMCHTWLIIHIEKCFVLL